MELDTEEIIAEYAYGRGMRIALTPEGIIIPYGYTWPWISPKGEVYIRLRDIKSKEHCLFHFNPVIGIEDIQGHHMIRSGLLDDEARIAITAHLGVEPEAHSHLVEAGGDLFGLLVWLKPLWLKLGVFLSFFGAPLYALDRLAPIMGDGPALLVGFGPWALMLFGTFSMGRAERDGLSHFLISCGAMASVAMTLGCIIALRAITLGQSPGDEGFILFGSVVGIAAATGYLLAWFRSVRPKIDPRSPAQSGSASHGH